MRTTIHIMLLLLVSMAGMPWAQDTPADIEVTVKLLDAGLFEVDDNAFVQGETILVQVQLVNAVAAIQRVEYDRAFVKAVQDGEVENIPRKPVLQSMPLRLGTAPWVGGVQFAWQRPSGAPRGVEPANLELSWKPNFLQQGPPADELELVTAEIWEIDTARAGTGAHRLAVQVPVRDRRGSELMSTDELEFTLIPQDQASGPALARMFMNQTREGVRAGDHVRTIQAANQALRHATPEHHDTAQLYRFLGDAHESLGDVAAASEAYRAGLEVAEQERGTSRLPYILRMKLDAMDERMSTPGEGPDDER